MPNGGRSCVALMRSDARLLPSPMRPWREVRSGGDAFNQDEVGLAAALPLLSGLLVFGRMVTIRCRLEAWKLQDDALTAQLSFDDLLSAAADEKSPAKSAERRERA